MAKQYICLNRFLNDMRIVLDNVEPKYMGILNELAQALQFTVSTVERGSKRAEIDKRIERLEARQLDNIMPDWQRIISEADKV